jgi:hypothetical protein
MEGKSSLMLPTIDQVEPHYAGVVLRQSCNIQAVFLHHAWSQNKRSPFLQRHCAIAYEALN